MSAILLNNNFFPLWHRLTLSSPRMFSSPIFLNCPRVQHSLLELTCFENRLGYMASSGIIISSKERVEIFIFLRRHTFQSDQPLYRVSIVSSEFPGTLSLPARGYREYPAFRKLWLSIALHSHHRTLIEQI